MKVRIFIHRNVTDIPAEALQLIFKNVCRDIPAEDHEKFVAAVANDIIRRADGRFQLLYDALQHRVPGHMAISVVDDLEMIHVDHGNRRIVLAGEIMLRVIAAVVGVGQRIGINLLDIVGQ